MRPVHISRVLGHIGWWVFVVGRLLAETAAGSGLPRRYADALPAGPPLSAATLLAGAALLALGVTVVAAIIDAVALDRRWLGAATVGAPILGAVLVLVALRGATSTPGTTSTAGWLGAAAGIGLGIALREGWSRAVVPALSPPPSS
ncbi:hypothetical protein H7J07_18315 [Mycobacterium koreense]|uniref:Uncharacterized protein n=1 Tax=Mycolicibacillus koreensis TaxID=1069220 RepID=A0AA91PAU0_9MYCO|nr:hypothetical protein [Mycolicibacillus koreensis]OSC25472.1 hypothetical protein B8W67_18990 [Mycolicibacillus koreensis]